MVILHSHKTLCRLSILGFYFCTIDEHDFKSSFKKKYFWNLGWNFSECHEKMMQKFTSVHQSLKICFFKAAFKIMFLYIARFALFRRVLVYAYQYIVANKFQYKSGLKSLQALQIKIQIIVHQIRWIL